MQKQKARRAGLAAEFFASQGRLLAAVIVAAAFGLGSLPAQARVGLPGTVPTHALETAVPVGPVNPYEQLSLAVSLPLRNQPDLRNLLERLYNPKDPLYGHYLTPDEFTSSFGPTQAQYNNVARFAVSQGLRVTGTSPNRLVLDLSGPAGRIETAFGVRLMNYRAADGHIFHAPATEASVPDSLGGDITGVAGLNSAFHARPLLVRPAAAGAFRPMNIGTGPGGGLAPSDIKTAYNLNNLAVNGGGETLAVMELDGYVPSDITTYENQFGLANVPLENILVDGGSGPLGGGQPEVSLDIELQISLAPGANKILVYEAPNTSAGFVDIYNKIATDNRAREISTSWGSEETNDPTGDAGADAAFVQMAAQGQSNYVAAGDNGALDNGTTIGVDFPAADPFVTGVGGTRLSVNSDQTYQSETTWNLPNDGAGGGGISTVYPIPSWQVGVISSGSLGSATMRNVPDVSLNADPETGYAVFTGDSGGAPSWDIFGGTSCAAPLWSAFGALVNQQRLAERSPAIGMANPALYAIGVSARYGLDFHDIADGSNNLFYPAVAGYDDATGWGSFNGIKLLNELAPAVIAPASITVNPTSVIAFTTATGNVTLVQSSGIIPVTVTLSSSNPAVAAPPPSISVPANTLSELFPITTGAVRVPTPVTITAKSAGVSVSTVLTVTPAPPNAPVNLVATALGPNSVLLNWVDGGGFAASYLVQRQYGSGPWTTVGSPVLVPTTQVVDQQNVPSNTTIFYQVIGVNAGGESAPSRIAVATTPAVPPGSPSGLTATPVSTSEIDLTWVPYPGDTGTAFVVERRLTGGAYTIITPTPITASSFKDTGLASGTTYYYRVYGSNAAGNSGSTNEVAATTQAIVLPPPAAPTGLTGSVSGSQVNLSWTDSHADYTGFYVERKTAGGIYAPLNAAPVTGLSYVDNSAIPNVAYTYRVKATNSAGDSGYSNEFTITVPNDEIFGTVTIASTAQPGVTIQLLNSSGAVTASTSTDSNGGYSFAHLSDGSWTVKALPPGSAPLTQTVTLSGAGGAPGIAVVNFAVGSIHTFPRGLTLASAPFDYSASSADALAVFGLTAPTFGTQSPVADYSSGGYQFYPNLPGTKTTPGKGYWVNEGAPQPLRVLGSAIQTPTYDVPLQPGWNLIGNPYTGSISWSSVKVKLPYRLGAAAPGTPISMGAAMAYRIVGQLYSYTGQATVIPPPPALSGANPNYTVASSVAPFVGYWVYVNPAVTRNFGISLSFTNPGS